MFTVRMLMEALMTAQPKGWIFTLGLTVLAIAGAVVASQTTFASTSTASGDEFSAESDPCFRYGRFECCLRGDE